MGREKRKRDIRPRHSYFSFWPKWALARWEAVTQNTKLSTFLQMLVAPQPISASFPHPCSASHKKAGTFGTQAAPFSIIFILYYFWCSFSHTPVLTAFLPGFFRSSFRTGAHPHFRKDRGRSGLKGEELTGDADFTATCLSDASSSQGQSRPYPGWSLIPPSRTDVKPEPL